ncbi:CSC1-like protein ERD4 [Linum perenne]
MDFSSFLTSLGTSFTIFLILMLLFAWLSRRPSNTVIYYPNRILKGMDPLEAGSTSASRNPFSWIREAVSSTEQDVITMSGVDTAVYFVFLATVLGIFAVSGLLLLPILLPVAMTDNNLTKGKSDVSNNTFDDLDKLSMGNITEKSPRLWAFLFATYWVSLVTYVFLWKAYHHVAGLRAAALMSLKAVKPEQYAVLVRDIPPPTSGMSMKEHVDSYFKAIHPDTFYRSMIVTDNKKVNKIYQDLEKYKKKLDRAEAVFAKSKDKQPEGVRPTNKTGFMGIFGKKVDSIEYFNGQINELVSKLEAEQKSTLTEKHQSSAFVFFTSRIATSAAAQSLHAQMANKWTVTDAPEPRQVLWTNLNMKFFMRQIRKYIVYFVVALTILFYMIPIGLISAFTTLGNLIKYLPFLKPVLKIAIIRTVLEAFLPQIALLVFLAMLPKLLLFLSKAEGIPSESHAIRAASGKYFYFNVLNVFIGVTVGNTLFNTFKDIEKDPNSAIDILASSLPGSATFFLTYVALKFFVGYGLELSRIIPLIIFHLKKKFVCKSEAEVKEAWIPGDLGYVTRIPGDMLIVTLVFCYSAIAPLIIPFGMLYFGLGWLLLRNQALKVYVPKYESYGRMWPHIHTRIVASLLLYQVLMFGYLGIKKFYYTPIVIILPITTLLFAFMCRKKFYRGFSNTALEVVATGDVKEEEEIPNMEEVYRRYIPHCLSADKIGDDHQYVDAVGRIGALA